METFYLPFVEGFQNFTDSFWLDEGGFFTSFIALVTVSFFMALTYYKFMDKLKYANTGKWFVFLFLSAVLTFAATLILVFSLSDGYLESTEIVIFSLINGLLYGSIFFFLFSLMLNNFSSNSKYVPFNLFNRK